MTDSLERALAFYEQKRHAEAPRSPFRFLDAYEREDRDYFFGRDAEIEDLRARFYKSRVIVIHGESGTGKTSLVQCGLANAIPEEEAEFHFVRSNVDPVEAVRTRLGAVGVRLADALDARAREVSRTVAIVFDQFEELFLFPPAAVRDDLLDQLVETLDRRLDVRIIFCIREEFLSRMTEVEARIPDVFAHRFWLRRMWAAEARKAIEVPCRRAGIELDERVTETLLDRLRDSRGEIDLPLLQILLDRLYRSALERGGVLRFRAEDVESSVTLADTLSEFLDACVRSLADPVQGRVLLKSLVTAVGTRKAVDAAGLVAVAQRASSVWPPPPTTVVAAGVQVTLDALVRARILRQDGPDAPYELRHDSLASVIAGWLTLEEEDDLKLRAVIEIRHAEYELTGAPIRDPALLERIARRQERLGLPSHLQTFLEHCLSRPAAARRRRRALVAVVVLAAMAVSLGAVLFWLLRPDGELIRFRSAVPLEVYFEAVPRFDDYDTSYRFTVRRFVGFYLEKRATNNGTGSIERGWDGTRLVLPGVRWGVDFVHAPHEHIERIELFPHGSGKVAQVVLRSPLPVTAVRRSLEAMLSTHPSIALRGEGADGNGARPDTLLEVTAGSGGIELGRRDGACAEDCQAMAMWVLRRLVLEPWPLTTIEELDLEVQRLERIDR